MARRFVNAGRRFVLFDGERSPRPVSPRSPMTQWRAPYFLPLVRGPFLARQENPALHHPSLRRRPREARCVVDRLGSGDAIEAEAASQSKRRQNHEHFRDPC